MEKGRVVYPPALFLEIGGRGRNFRRFVGIIAGRCKVLQNQKLVVAFAGGWVGGASLVLV